MQKFQNQKQITDNMVWVFNRQGYYLVLRRSVPLKNLNPLSHFTIRVGESWMYRQNLLVPVPEILVNVSDNSAGWYIRLLNVPTTAYQTIRPSSVSAWVHLPHPAHPLQACRLTCRRMYRPPNFSSQPIEVSRAMAPALSPWGFQDTGTVMNQTSSREWPTYMLTQYLCICCCRCW